jgi:hypothetical protein
MKTLRLGKYSHTLLLPTGVKLSFSTILLKILDINLRVAGKSDPAIFPPLSHLEHHANLQVVVLSRIEDIQIFSLMQEEHIVRKCNLRVS